jgi:hypothetical protein
MVLFSAKRNMVKRTSSLLLISLFFVSPLLFTESTAKAEEDDILPAERVIGSDTTSFEDSYKSLNSSNESLATTLGNSGCTALGGVVGSTLSSLGKQLVNGTGINTLGSSINNALGGGALGNAAGSVVGSTVNNVTNSVMKGVTGTAGGIVNSITSGVDGLATKVLSSDLLAPAATAVGGVFQNLGVSLGSQGIADIGNSLSGMASGETLGSMSSLFSGAGGSIPGISSVMSLIGGGSLVPTDPQTISKQISTLQKDTSILKTKETCLNRIAFTSAQITRSKIQNDVMKWLNTGNNGNPLYVTNMNDYINKQTQNQTKLFISDLSKSNSPYKNETIKAVIASQETNTSAGRIARYEDPLTKAIGSTNAERYRSGDTTICPTIKCFVLAAQNNVVSNYLKASEDLGSSMSKAKEEVKMEVGESGITPEKECLDKGSEIVDGACRKTRIVTPAEVVRAKLERASTAPEENAGNIGADSNETVSQADLILQAFLTSDSFWGVTDTNNVSSTISKQEITSSGDVVDRIEETTNSLIGYIAIRDETRNVIFEAASTTDNMIALNPVTYCPGNLANQSSSGAPSLFDRATSYNQAMEILNQEISIIGGTMIKLEALKTGVSSGKIDYQTAAEELTNISTSGGVPSSSMASGASSELSQSKTIRDQTAEILSLCKTEHQQILDAEAAKANNVSTQPVAG